jgi:hypothetical protein
VGYWKDFRDICASIMSKPLACPNNLFVCAIIPLACVMFMLDVSERLRDGLCGCLCVQNGKSRQLDSRNFVVLYEYLAMLF